MTDQASGTEGPATPRFANRRTVLVAAAIVVVLVIAAVIYASTGSSSSKMTGLITDDVKGQFVTQDVSCHKIGFKAPNLTKSQIYACDVAGVTQANRPPEHVHDESFTRCYIRSGSDQTVDISHPIAVIAGDRHQKSPCS